MNIEQEIFEAKIKNWCDVITQKVERLIKEHINDVDLSIKLLNGDFYEMAQTEFACEIAQGKYDNMVCPVDYLGGVNGIR